MDNFAVIYPKEGEFVALILATHYRMPHEFLDELVLELNNRSRKGPVVFDLLLAQGSLDRRFFRSDFDGTSLKVLRSFEKVEPPLEIKQLSAQFFKQKAKEVDFSLLLNKELKRQVKKGVVL